MDFSTLEYVARGLPIPPKQDEVKPVVEDVFVQNALLDCSHQVELTNHISDSIGKKCLECELNQNLWLCLTCGNIGCGRAQFDGSGGNNHASIHFKNTSHPVSIKLGTITAEGTVDGFCYKCDDLVVVKNLEKTVARFGIKLKEQTKTEKSLMELQDEQNASFQFSMATSDGTEYTPVFGPGLTGLANFGNTCYIASVIQSIFSLKPIYLRYFDKSHWETCQNSNPAFCFLCQMLKLMIGLHSGDYSVPDKQEATHDLKRHKSESDLIFQKGILIKSFKSIVANGNPDFVNARQQDAYEYWNHLYNFLIQKDRAEIAKSPSSVLANSPSLASFFEFQQIDRVQCTNCKAVKILQTTSTSIACPVPAKPASEISKNKWLERNSRDLQKEEKVKDLLEPVFVDQCVKDWKTVESIDGFNCSACSMSVTAIKSSGFGTFPAFLVMHMQRFVLENWVPKKLNISIRVGSDNIDLTSFKESDQLKPNEVAMPEAAPKPNVNETHVEQLMGMGFSRNRSVRACLAVAPSASVEMAMEWLFSKMDDPCILRFYNIALDDPIENESKEPADAGTVSMLCDMGFTPKQAKKALSKTDGNPERAIEWLFSHPDDLGEEEGSSTKSVPTSHAPMYHLHAIIAHKGPSVHCGHYVAFVRNWKSNDDSQKWILFNDEKVVALDTGIEYKESANENGSEMGYVYVWVSSDVVSQLK